ncbi:MAG: hypothetical protein JRC77_08450 [Deltaproteobacteria bacterium]|nr:hypothetical protein [Deltaproteobacteria bacterium]
MEEADPAFLIYVEAFGVARFAGALAFAAEGPVPLAIGGKHLNLGQLGIED